MYNIFYGREQDSGKIDQCHFSIKSHRSKKHVVDFKTTV